MLKCETSYIVGKKSVRLLAANMRLVMLCLCCLAACKPLTSSTATIDAELYSYEELQLFYSFYFHEHQGAIRLTYMQELAQYIATSLAKNVFANQEQRDEMRRMLHKIRSFITYGKLSGCLEQNEDGNFVSTEETAKQLCSIILTKIKELDYHHIDLAQSNQAVFENPHSSKHSEQELFAALHTAILANKSASISKYQRIFPFTTLATLNTCRELNRELVHVPVDVTKITRHDYVSIHGPDLAPPAYTPTSYPQLQQKNDHCQQLAEAITKSSPPAQNEKTFADAAELQTIVNNYVLRLNATIDRLDRLVHGSDGDKPAIKKENFFVFKIAKAVDFDNENVVNAYDEYTQILLEAARDGVLPLMILYYKDKLHLNIKGAWAGLKAMKYTPLAYPLSRKLEEAIASLHEHLVTRWLQLQSAREKKVKDKKIYELLVNNDIATARLIMQDPAYSLPVTHLLDKYQDDNRAPKWLQVLKSWTYRLDMLFIPLTIAAGLISGGAAFPIVAGIAVSINFFWVGVTGTETILARKRYAVMERALLSGNSTQVERGAKLLREFHNKRRSLVIAGTVGVPLSIPSLKMAVQGIEGAKTIAIDVGAAFASDVDGFTDGGDLDLLGRFDDKSDAELLQDH